MTSPIYYLAETRCDGGDHPELGVFDAAGLASFLARNIEHEHYSGSGHEIVRLFRYSSGGTLTPLVLHPVGEDRGSGDWLYWHYEACAADATHDDGSHVTELAFTVRIDGRA